MALYTNLKRVNQLALTTQRLSSTAAVCSNSLPLHERNYCNGKPPAHCKVAIVTGGARGIGFHISESLLKAGAQAVILGDVLIKDLEDATCKLNEKYGENKALFQPCDVTKKEEMEKMFQCTKDKFGKIDIVVNNAGIAESDWKKIVKINVKGLIHGTLLGFQHMGTHCGGKGGHIINVASILGLQPLYSMPVYCGTKWFVVGFTKSMGSEYFNNLTKVKVMAVCPGVTDTEIIKNAGQATLPTFDGLAKEAAKSLASLPPQGPEEVGRSVIEMLKDGENGSVWVSEGCETYKTVMPDRSTFKPPPKNPCDTIKPAPLPCPEKEKDDCQCDDKKKDCGGSKKNNCECDDKKKKDCDEKKKNDCKCDDKKKKDCGGKKKDCGGKKKKECKPGCKEPDNSGKKKC